MLEPNYIKIIEDIIDKLELGLSTEDSAILKDLINNHKWEIAFSIIGGIIQEKGIIISKDFYKIIEKTFKKMGVDEEEWLNIINILKNKEFSKSNILLEGLKNKKNVEDIINKLESELSIKDIDTLKDLMAHREWEITFSILCDVLQEKDIFISKDIYKIIEKTGKKMGVDEEEWLNIRTI